jgi:hypothetical protein
LVFGGATDDHLGDPRLSSRPPWNSDAGAAIVALSGPLDRQSYGICQSKVEDMGRDLPELLSADEQKMTPTIPFEFRRARS